MAARKPRAYKVVGAAAVIRKDKHERYLYRGAAFPADAIDEDNAKHLLAAGLIEAAAEIVDAEAEAAAAKKAAEEAAAAAVKAAGTPPA